MILYPFLVFVALSSLLAAARWRFGPFLMVAAAMLQDPVRKMLPGAPPYVVLATVPIWCGTIIGAVIEGDFGWQRFRALFPGLSWGIMLFLVLLIPPAVLSATYSPGSWQVTLLGLYAYLSVVIGILLGTAYPRRPGDIERLLAWYCILVSVMLVGAPLERLGIATPLPIVGTRVMGHQWVTYRTGGVLRMVAGFFRSPDVMGWHAAALVMVAITLALKAPRSRRHLWAVLAGWGGIGVMLCGRRKMIGMLPFFAVALASYYVLFRQAKRIIPLAAAFMAALLVGAYAYTAVGPDRELEEFYSSTIGEVGDRAFARGIQAITTTYRQAGFLGYGLGMATQGTHHIGVERPRAWQEGGSGKIMAELGVPGFACFLLVVAALLAASFRVLRQISATPEHPVHFGLSAFVLANAIGAVVSAQIFGDPFIGAFLPFLVGLVLSGARLEMEDLHA